ncbi:DNA repair and recombination protein RAD54B [Fasciola gigantica]|uniref:DNA repair and recombination protein RAD54B n=1 Tax=Fasciola gigantica TaxID=46835 RepID=A0A504YXZ0_FASGI|nr:DNA repair and recombination protein RAD54B [Fasciola gigantica]
MKRSAAPSRCVIRGAEKRLQILSQVSLPCSSVKEPVDTCPEESKTLSVSDQSLVTYYEAVYAKLSTKKHKKWEGDGFVVISGRAVKLISESGKTLSSGSGHKLSFLHSLEEGSLIKVGGMEAELLGRISPCTYQRKVTGVFHGPVESDKIDPPQMRSAPGQPACVKATSQQSSGIHSFKTMLNPPIDQTVDALVMRPPPGHCVWAQNPDGLPITNVVLNAQLNQRLRPHQKEGVRFLYECLMGFNSSETIGNSSSNPIYGCILADEMGLGKTVQAIATLWMLLTQGPYGGRPVIQKCLIVTPSSLIENWANEITKWVGRERLPYYCVTQNSTIKTYIAQANRSAPVLILSYEMFLQHASEICEIPNLDMVICDEGHRLKNAGISTSLALRNLPTRRRLLLTGTPVQNHLHELWSLADFCAPGRLAESQEAFRRKFVLTRCDSRTSRDLDTTSGSTEEELSSSYHLSRLLSTFLLRRTVDVIQTELPAKSEFVVFCSPSTLQAQLEDTMRDWIQNELNALHYPDRSGSPLRVSTTDEEDDFTGDQLDMDVDFEDWKHFDLDTAVRSKKHLSGFGSQSILCAITAFRKMYNHPALLFKYIESALEKNNIGTLDLLDVVCRTLTGSTPLRLDGQTPQKRRLDLVQEFNNLSSPSRILLLSTRAGGTGLNLIGADHLILFDMDWNPASDVQAMARIWRPGQRRPVCLYRLVTCSGLEERMFQRQAAKLALSHRTLDMAWDDSFSVPDVTPVNRCGVLTREELRVGYKALPNCTSCTQDLFQAPNPEWLLWTHELIGCLCQSPDSQSSPSLSTDSDTPSINASKRNTESDCDFSDKESDRRTCQLGPVIRERITRSDSFTGIPTSESLAYLLNWKHSLSESAIADLKDPLLSMPIDEKNSNEGSVRAVFSRVTGQL